MWKIQEHCSSLSTTNSRTLFLSRENTVDPRLHYTIGKFIRDREAALLLDIESFLQTNVMVNVLAITEQQDKFAFHCKLTQAKRNNFLCCLSCIYVATCLKHIDSISCTVEPLNLIFSLLYKPLSPFIYRFRWSFKIYESFSSLSFWMAFIFSCSTLVSICSPSGNITKETIESTASWPT